MFYSLRSTEMYFSSGIIIIKCSIDAIIFEWNQQVKNGIQFETVNSQARLTLSFLFFYTYERTCMKNGLPNDRWMEMEMEVARFDVIVHGVCVQCEYEIYTNKVNSTKGSRKLCTHSRCRRRAMFVVQC